MSALDDLDDCFDAPLGCWGDKCPEAWILPIRDRKSDRAGLCPSCYEAIMGLLE